MEVLKRIQLARQALRNHVNPDMLTGRHFSADFPDRLEAQPCMGKCPKIAHIKVNLCTTQTANYPESGDYYSLLGGD